MTAKHGGTVCLRFKEAAVTVTGCCKAQIKIVAFPKVVYVRLSRSGCHQRIPLADRLDFRRLHPACFIRSDTDCVIPFRPLHSAQMPVGREYLQFLCAETPYCVWQSLRFGDDRLKWFAITTCCVIIDDLVKRLRCRIQLNPDNRNVPPVTTFLYEIQSLRHFPAGV